MIKRLILISFVVVLLSKSYYSQSLTGVSGLLTVPTADILEDRQISFGGSFLNKEYLDFEKCHGVAYYAVIGYLPFLEVSLRLTRWYHPEQGFDYGKQGIGDRMPNLKLRLWKESKFLPSIVVGIHDLISVLGNSDDTNFNAFYGAMSKHYLLNNFDYIQSIGLHLGYGVDMIEAKNHQFVGVFGGVDVQFRKELKLLFEFTDNRINLGVESLLFNHFRFLGGYENLKFFSGGLGFQFKI